MVDKLDESVINLKGDFNVLMSYGEQLIVFYVVPCNDSMLNPA